jgi:GT2 family glycosyltransferase
VTTARRVLLVITVYNGQTTVPSCLASAARIADGRNDINILVLDDASPTPGWSAEVEKLCVDLGLQYYCSPRNLGIPRNVNLGLLAAMHGDYDFVAICNSDVIFPMNLVDQLLAVADTDPLIGSVTAFSNNVSAYSLPVHDPDIHLNDQGLVDWLSATMAGEFGDTAIDIPAGISFCILIPIPALRRIGIMDPVFGRGYCEETDWSLRSLAAGYRVALAPGTFVYHKGQGSTAEAGMLSGGHTTVPANERIIDLRYPLFRSQVDAFVSSDILPTLHRNSARRIVVDAARHYGYTLHVSWIGRLPPDSDTVRCIVEPDGAGPAIVAMFKGFSSVIPLNGRSVIAAIREELGGDPLYVNVFDSGSVRDALVNVLGQDRVQDRFNYPERV